MSNSSRIELDRTHAFFRAAAKGDCAKLRAMLGAGQNVDARDDAGKTALLRAAERGHIAAAQVLLTAGADASASVSDRDSVWYGCNSLLFAAQSGSPELVELLIKSEASLKCEAADGTTPLGLAVEHRSPRMVKALL